MARDDEARLPTGTTTRGELLERALESSGLGDLGIDPKDLKVFVGEAEVGEETIGLYGKDGNLFALVVDVTSPGAIYAPGAGRWLLFKLGDIPIPEAESAE